MSMQQVSVLEVLITADATQLKIGMAQAQAATTEFAAATQASSAATTKAGASATTFGKLASQAATYAKLGMIAFAAVSIKAAIDFDRAFTQIAAITNTTADRIDSLKATVLDLSSETAVAPIDLAHAMYFLASAGLDVNQQMTALDAVARGVAIGLGDAGDLARITANALNVFADNGLTATDVMDTLTAAVREGTAEPDEFASALGRVLPIADQAGISFQAVAASLASMSNAGLDVNEGVTSLRAILQSLVAPTAQTETAFKTMGLSVDDVVQSMQGEGLIATLRLLKERAKGVTDGVGEFNQLMRHAIPNIRGLAGAFNLLKQDGDKIDAIFQAVSRSAGAMDRAFEITAESDAFKVKQALNDINIVGQKLGTVVLPLIAHGLSGLAREATAIEAQFTDLKDGLSLKDAANLVALPVTVASFGLIPKPFGTDQDIATMNRQLDQVNLMIASSGEDLDAQAKIYNDALASVGGTVDPGNVDEFTTAVRDSITAMKLQEQTADNNAKAMAHAAESTKGYAKANAVAALALSDLSNLGQDAVSFLTGLHQTLEESDDPAKDFGAAIADLTGQWNDFRAQARQALDFTTQALTDMGSAAQAAQDQLAGDTSSLSQGALADLGDQATITGDEIVTAFQKANQQTKQFSQDLLDISRVGGSAGKALAASLLETGNTTVAAAIANAPNEKELVGMYGRNQARIDKLSGKLTDSIVGPLNSIVHILTQLAENVWKIDVNGDGVIGVGKDLDKAQQKANHLFGPNHKLITNIKDQISRPLDGIQGDVDHLVGGHYNVKLGLDKSPAQTALANFDSTLDTFLQKKRTVFIGVHTGAESPWPDEALKEHLVDPMKAVGFKKVGDVYTLPLEVGAHTTAEGPTGGGRGMAHLGALLAVEKDSRAFLKEISKAVKGGDGNGVHGHLGGTGGGGTGSGGGGGGGSVSLSDSLTASVDKVVGTINKFATVKEAKGVVERVAHAGRDTAFIRESIQQVSKELGKTAAERYGKALRDLDEATRDSEKRRNAALQESLDAIEAIRQAHQAKMDARRTKQALGFEMKNVPGLPRGHTNIDPNAHALGGPGHHPRALTVVMDRRHYADSLSQEVSYGRGY